MPEKEILQAHCNACGGVRKHHVVHKEVRDWEQRITQQNSIWGENKYALLECCGCESMKLHHSSMFSEDCDDEGRPLVHEWYYPPPTFRPEPKWLMYLDHEWHITKLMREVYKALHMGSPALAAMGIRAVLEAIMIDKCGDKGSFGGNLKAFQESGYISKIQRESLEAALEIGHASIHRGFIPQEFQLEICADIMESMIHTLYFLEGRAKNSVKNVPKMSGRADR